MLVHDHGRDDSPRVMRELAAQYDFVKTVWLSRNFGQHAATLAGIAASSGHWVVTMDEDGQHDPAYIGALLDAAIASGTSLVYAQPQNKPSHGFFRNWPSRAAKWTLSVVFSGGHARDFQSFRLIGGGVGRKVAAFAGAGVYLDVALSWVAPAPASAPIMLRRNNFV